MEPTVEQVRALARSAPERWESLHLVHRSGEEEVEARLRHGKLDVVRRSDGRVVSRERGAPPTSWRVRPLEPMYDSYTWPAMLDPYELSEHVTITEVRAETLFDRPVWRLKARAGAASSGTRSCPPRSG